MNRKERNLQHAMMSFALWADCWWIRAARMAPATVWSAIRRTSCPIRSRSAVDPLKAVRTACIEEPRT